MTVEAVDPTHLFMFSGPELREPVVFDGNFIMNDRSQLEAAVARYRAGEMRRLAPLSAN